MDITWDIYTLGGRRVQSVRLTAAPAGPNILRWDGRDARGDEIANGVYLYVLRGRWHGSEDRDINQTGQLVIMR